jgi:metabolite-proton symporter
MQSWPLMRQVVHSKHDVMKKTSDTRSLPTSNSATRILIASLAGTTIEFFDFYIYATAAVLVFPKLFFPSSDATAATLESLATFALAFFARPVGAALFGHFGDRIGRKATLIAALLTMGISTVLIGFLPTYASIGAAAPILLALCRLGQGLGLGGEWGGAILLATENAPPGKRAWYGMFPQLGAPLGFLCSGGLFLLLSLCLSNDQFISFGWRLPFVASSALILVGLYVRLKITETPAFLESMNRNERVAIPMISIFREHSKALILGTLIAVATFVLFYLLTVFCLSWGTTHLGYSRNEFLVIQLIGVLFFGATVPFSASLADRYGRRITLILISGAILVFGLILGPLFSSGVWGVMATMIIGFSLMGMTYGPLGTLLSELYPTAVRYTGASVSFSMAGILGASLAPYIATSLALTQGLNAVGYYLGTAAVLSLAAVWLSSEATD